MDARWTIHGDVMWAGEGFRGWCVVAVCLIEVVTSHFCRLSLSPCRRYITVNHTRGYRRRIPESGACIRQEHSRDVARGVGIWGWIHPSLSGVKILISAESGEVNMHQIVSLSQKKKHKIYLWRDTTVGEGVHGNGNLMRMGFPWESESELEWAWECGKQDMSGGEWTVEGPKMSTLQVIPAESHSRTPLDSLDSLKPLFRPDPSFPGMEGTHSISGGLRIILSTSLFLFRVHFAPFPISASGPLKCTTICFYFRCDLSKRILYSVGHRIASTAMLSSAMCNCMRVSALVTVARWFLKRRVTLATDASLDAFVDIIAALVTAMYAVGSSSF